MVALGPGYSSAGASRLRSELGGTLGTASPSLGQLATQSVGNSTPQISSPLAAPAAQALSPAQAVQQAAQSMGFTSGILPWGGTDPNTGVNLRQAIVGQGYQDWLGSNYGWQSAANIDPGAGNAGGLEGGYGVATVGTPSQGSVTGFGMGYGPGEGGAVAGFSPGESASLTGLGGLGGQAASVPGQTGIGYGSFTGDAVAANVAAYSSNPGFSAFGPSFGAPPGYSSGVPPGETGVPGVTPGETGVPGVTPGDTGFGDTGFGSASAFGGPTGLGIGNPGEAGTAFGSSIGSVGMDGGFGGLGGFGDAAGIGSGIGDGSGGGGGGGGGK